MADPDKARQEFADALAGPLGVFEEPTQLVAVTTDEEYSNPLGEINRVWGEVYMNASMESILNGFDDPRREAFFEPCPDDVLLPDRDGRDSVLIPLKGQYRGIRQGTMFAHTLYSALSKIYVNVQTKPILMTAAEVWFLRAEAALRGWTAEDPEFVTSRVSGVHSPSGRWPVWKLICRVIVGRLISRMPLPPKIISRLVV